MRMRSINILEDDWSRAVRNIINDGFAKIRRVVNWISFADNIASQAAEVTTSSADTEVEVSHTLGSIITHVWIVDSDKAATIYRSRSTWSDGTDDKVYFKCNVADATLKLALAI